MSPITVMPTSRDEVIAAVRQLVAHRPASRSEVADLERQRVALAVHIQKHISLHDVPEAVWHFLSDADIRFKDPQYATVQLGEITAVLDRWQAQVPSNTSLERTRER
jgi:hypothetical protein